MVYPRAKGWVPAPGEPISYADRLIRHQKGTEGPLHQVDPPEDVTPRADKSAKAQKQPKEGKTEKMGEYKCVWLCVIILVLGMFLCLFLYSFGIIKVM